MSGSSGKAGGLGLVGCRIGHSVDQAVADTTNVALAFDDEATAGFYDTHGFHDTVTNNSRITIPAGQAGTYDFCAEVEAQNNVNGTRKIYFRKNGAQRLTQHLVPAAGTGTDPLDIALVALGIPMLVADYVELICFWTSGISLNAVRNAGWSPVFSARRVA